MGTPAVLRNTADMGPIDLRHLHHERSRHGKMCTYVRLPGCRRVRVTNPEDPESIAEAFRVARSGAAAVPAASTRNKKRIEGSLAALVALYSGSPEFKRLGAKTQATRRGILDGCILEVWEGEKDWVYGDCPAKELRARDCRTIRDRKADFPEAANGRLKALRALLEWGVEHEHIERNVAKDVAYIENVSEGHHAWSVDEVRQYERVHSVGSMARLALALLLYTGQRRSDVVLFGRQHVNDGWLTFVQVKNRANKPVEIDIPILPELAAVIGATPSSGLAFLETQFGRPFTSNGFGNRFRKWCDEAGLPQCSAHGLRKAGAAIAAENGATERQLMAIFGWSTSKEASRYTRSARRRRLAGNAMHLLVPTQTENGSPAPFSPVEQGAGTRSKKAR